MKLRVGQEFFWIRKITAADIQAFGRISGDRGRHHVQPDGQGRLMAQGLLTATLPTKLGGDLNYVARTMRFEFVKPVYSGDRLRCVGRVARLRPGPDRVRAWFSFVITNQRLEAVMSGATSGVIFLRKGAAPQSRRRPPRTG